MSSRIRPFPIVGLHGAPALVPPGSTLASFQKAIDCGATMLAAAVRTTADGVPVVDHEAMRGWNGEETPLRKRAWAEWQAYTADTDTPLASLTEFLALACQQRVGVLLDVREAGVEGALARAVRPSGLPMSDLLVCAPTPESRRTLRVLDPRIPQALLLEADAGVSVDAKLLASLDTDAVCWAGKLITPPVVKVLRLRGILVYAWDVDLLDEMRRLRDGCGVDGIATHLPDLLAALPPAAPK